MSNATLQTIVESLLFVSDKPVSLTELQAVLKTRKPDIGAQDVKDIIAELRAYYESSARSFQIYEVAAGYQIKTLPQYAEFIGRLLKDELKDRLSIPSLETLAIIAYKQPVTRAEVEEIRGVNIDGVIVTLLEKNLIRITGKKESPGRPFLFGTTREFLLHFGLKDLQELPNMEEFKAALVARERQLEQQRAAAGKDVGELETAAAVEMEGAAGTVLSAGTAGAAEDARVPSDTGQDDGRVLDGEPVPAAPGSSGTKPAGQPEQP